MKITAAQFRLNCLALLLALTLLPISGQQAVAADLGTRDIFDIVLGSPPLTVTPTVGDTVTITDDIGWCYYLSFVAT